MKRFWKCIVRNNCSNSELFTGEMAALHDAAAHPFATFCRKRPERSRVKVHDWAPTCTDVTCKSSLDPDKPVYFSQAPAHTHAHKDERVGALCRVGHTLRLSSCRLAGAKQSNPIPPLHVLQSHALHEVRVWREAYHKQRPRLMATAGAPPEPPQRIKG